MVGFSLNRLARELRSAVVGASFSPRSKAVRQRTKAKAPSMDCAVQPKAADMKAPKLKATKARRSASDSSASNLSVVKIPSPQKFQRCSPKLFDSQLDQDQNAQGRLF